MANILDKGMIIKAMREVKIKILLRARIFIWLWNGVY